MMKKILRRGTAILLLAALLCTAVSCKDKEKKAEPFDFLNTDLSEYVTVDPAAYHGKVLSVGVAQVTDEDVDDRILQLRAKNKDTTALYDGAYLLERTTACGDVVYIYYRGYMLDDDGKKIDLYGKTSNFSSESGSTAYNPEPTALEIGSGDFVPGFELGLIGKNPADYEKFSPVGLGMVKTTDRVVVTYTVGIKTNEPDKIDYAETAFIDLNDPTIDATYGVGFAEMLKDRSIGSTASNIQLSLPGGNNDYVLYTTLCVNFVFRESEKTPITVETHFPDDYDEPTLAGKTVYFEVYITKTKAYNAPEVDDAFLSETLALTDLQTEGTAEEKLRAYVRSEIEKERRESAKSLLKDKMWEVLLAAVPVKKYPEDEIERIYVQNKNALTEAYKQNITAYGSLDEFILSYFGLGLGDNWQTYMRDEIRAEVGEELVLYALMKQENLVPTEEQFAKSYEECLEMIYEDYEKESGRNRAYYDSDEAYEEAKSTMKANLENYYGEEYFTQGAYYEFAGKGLLKLFDLYVNGEKFSVE